MVHIDNRYFEGICMLCHESPIQVRHINIYPNGSEGLFICHECEMKKLLPFVRQCAIEGFQFRKANFLARRSINKEEIK